ncbi:MAG: hypothetical protein NZ455_03695 [Bacteroidia bacterium]|nr:hypothetical protein [Bacteroidia bacterium]MDW8347479.1 hypothetical protein [Bacteroidia bacterium]
MRRVRQQCAALAKHRSVSVARSTPTRAQRRDTPKKYNLFVSKEILFLNFILFLLYAKSIYKYQNAIHCSR